MKTVPGQFGFLSTNVEHGLLSFLKVKKSPGKTGLQPLFLPWLSSKR